VKFWSLIFLDVWHAFITIGVAWIIYELTRQRR
jgi:hypothetical protein